MYISTIQRAERIMLAKTTMIPGATGQTFHQYIKSTAATAKLQMARHIPGRSSRTLNFHLSFGCLFLQMWMPAMAAKKRLRPIMTKNQPQVEMMGSQMAQVRWSTTMKMLWRKAILMMRSSFSLSGASLCQIECSLFIRRTITPPATPLSPIEISPIKNNKNIIILADFKSDYQRIKIKVIIGIIEQLFLNYPAKLYIMTKITQLTDFVCFQLHDGLRINHQGFKKSIWLYFSRSQGQIVPFSCSTIVALELNKLSLSLCGKVPLFWFFFVLQLPISPYERHGIAYGQYCL